MVHQRNRWIRSGHGFTGSFDAPWSRQILGSLIRIRIIPKERSLKLWTLKYGSKSMQTSVISRQRPQKSYKLWKFSWFPWYSLKCMGKHSGFHLSFQIEGAWRDFTVNTKLIKIFNHISRSITLSLFTLKASYLVKWPISTWSFMWKCQFIDWLKFETRPSALLNFGTANITRLW